MRGPAQRTRGMITFSQMMIHGGTQSPSQPLEDQICWQTGNVVAPKVDNKVIVG